MLHHPTLRRVSAISIALLIGAGAAPAAFSANTNLQFKAEASVKETFDSNVYLQDESGTPANIAAA